MNAGIAEVMGGNPAGDQVKAVIRVGQLLRGMTLQGEIYPGFLRLGLGPVEHGLRQIGRRYQAALLSQKDRGVSAARRHVQGFRR